MNSKYPVLADNSEYLIMTDEQWVSYYDRWTVSILLRQMNSEYPIMTDE